MSTRNNNRITKPRVTNAKSSDRRLAAGVRPETFLLSQQRNNQIQLSQELINKTTTNKPVNSSYDNNRSNSSGTTHSSRDKYNKDNTKNKLEDWNPKHFRLFVGNLGSDANDTVLLKAFAKFKSISKVSVPIDKSGENKGYGFVAFEDPNDYLNAFKELNGKYIGHNPCVLKKANDLNKKNNNKGKNKR